MSYASSEDNCCMHAPLRCRLVASTNRRWGLFLQLRKTQLAFWLILISRVWWKGPMEETEVPQTTGNTEPEASSPVKSSDHCSCMSEPQLDRQKNCPYFPTHRITEDAKSLLFYATIWKGLYNRSNKSLIHLFFSFFGLILSSGYLCI